jgi:hypothetical protein
MITVTTAATKAKSRLISVATARTALAIQDQDDDALLQGFCDRASDVIARRCNRTFARETVTETFRCDRMQEELILSRYPLARLPTIVENDVTLNEGDYEVNADNGMVTRLYGSRPCWWPHGTIVVTYSAGYDLPGDCPPALAHACIQLVKSMYMAVDRDPMVRTDATDNLSSATYLIDSMPPEVSAILSSFRNFRLR